MKVFLDDHLIDGYKARVSVFDHGFLYGDGIYETVRAYEYHVFHWPAHFKRLQNSARRIALRCPWSSSYLRKALTRVLRANHQPTGSVRITVSRGPGPLGLDPTVCPRPTLALMLHPDRDLQAIWNKGISIGIVQVRRNPPESLDPQIKSNNALNTILAKMEAQRMRVFEGILLNGKGSVTEGTTSNIFFVRKSELHTPSLDCGLLEGITRGVLIKLARKEGLPVHEGRYTVGDLLRADECFLASTTLEVAPVVAVAQRKAQGKIVKQPVGSGSPGPLTWRFHALFRAYIQKEKVCYNSLNDVRAEKTQIGSAQRQPARSHAGAF